MSPLARNVLIAFGVCTLAGIATCGACTLMVSRGVNNLQAHSEGTMAEAEAFAEGRTEADCVSEAIERQTRCGPVDFSCAALVGVFVHTCYNLAAPSPELCAGLPADRDSIIALTAWKQRQCRGHANPTACEVVMGTLPTLCDNVDNGSAEQP